MLLDHFRPPLKGVRHWEAFHSSWASNLAAELNRILPIDWFAEPTVHYGIQVAQDVAAWDGAVSATTSPSPWSPESPTLTLDFLVTTDMVQVDVYNQISGPVLAGAIELVSPSNKDRPDARAAFVGKCASLLHEVIGLVVVDVVTDRHANLHNDLIQHLGGTVDAGQGLYECAYRPTARDEHSVLDIWHRRLTIQGSLPTMPLYLKNGPCVPVDLQKTYMQTRQDHRLN